MTEHSAPHCHESAQLESDTQYADSIKGSLRAQLRHELWKGKTVRVSTLPKVDNSWYAYGAAPLVDWPNVDLLD